MERLLTGVSRMAATLAVVAVLGAAAVHAQAPADAAGIAPRTWEEEGIEE